MPEVFYQLEDQFAQRLPTLSAAQRRGLALWVYGTLLAGSACQNAVLSALYGLAGWNSLRQRLREWLYDGADRARPCSTQLDVRVCFAPLLGWVLRHWPQEEPLLLALDATGHRDCLTGLVISVLYRGNAIPVAWHLLVGNQKEAWNPHWQTMLAELAPAVRPAQRVLVLCDRGLWSPLLYKQITAQGWHPLMRVQNSLRFRPDGARVQAACRLVPDVDWAWVGRGVAFGTPSRHLRCTLVAVWLSGQEAACLCVTNLAPDVVPVGAYGLRMWIEAGFRSLKRLGWQWEKTRRTDPVRANRHFLVLAVATLCTLAAGTQQEQSEGTAPVRRVVSVFRRGLLALRACMYRGVWPQQVLLPEPIRQLEHLTLWYHRAPDTS